MATMVLERAANSFEDADELFHDDYDGLLDLQERAAEPDSFDPEIEALVSALEAGWTR